MPLPAPRRAMRPFTALFIAAIMLVSSFAVAGQANAGRSVCRTDPIITFNDGTVVQLVALIEADASQISNITYVIHVPHGMQATSIDYWDSDPVTEVVTVLDDYAPGHYSGTATVNMAPRAKKTNWSVFATLNNLTTKTFRGDTNKVLRYEVVLPPGYGGN